MKNNHFVRSGAASLFVESVGGGLPIIFLHANVADSRMWHAQLDSLGTENKAIAYDRRGFGKTVTAPERFSAVLDLMAVIEAVSDGAPAILVGCSRGGRIAIDAALRHPERFRALALIAPSISGAPEANNSLEITSLLQHATEVEKTGDIQRQNEVKARLWLDGPLAQEGRVNGLARQLFLEMNGTALRNRLSVGVEADDGLAYRRLKEISMPTLVISGNLDFPFIQERSRHIARTVRYGAYHEVPGTAHLPSLEQPEKITRLLADFISANRT